MSQQRYNVAATSQRCSDVVTTLLLGLFAGVALSSRPEIRLYGGIRTRDFVIRSQACQTLRHPDALYSNRRYNYFISPQYIFNPFMPSGLFYLNSLDRFISYRRGVWLLILIIIMFCRYF